MGEEVELSVWWRKYKTAIYMIIAIVGYLTLALMIFRYNNLVDEYLLLSKSCGL